MILRIILLVLSFSIVFNFFIANSNNALNNNLCDETNAITTTVIDSSNGVVYLNDNFAKSYYCIDPGASYYSGTKTINGKSFSYKNTGVDYFSGKKIIKDDIYERYDTYIIEDLTGLQIFSDNVWWIDPASGDSGNARNRNFYGKTIKLACDIDVGKSSNYGSLKGAGWTDHWEGSYGQLAQFEGTFDGCGYSIQYFNLSSDHRTWFSDKEGGVIGIGAKTYYYVFCGFINSAAQTATIKNLRLANFTAKGCNPDSSWKLYVGGLVGHTGNNLSNSTSRCEIRNCSVENFNATFGNNAANSEYAASIVCKGKAAMYDCYVSNC